MKRCTILTPIFGNYDILHEDQLNDDFFDYVCITDNPDLKSNIYKIVLFNEPEINQQSGRYKTYYVRYNLDKFINTEYCLWIDADVVMTRYLLDYIKKCIIENKQIFSFLSYDNYNDYLFGPWSVHKNSTAITMPVHNKLIEYFGNDILNYDVLSSIIRLTCLTNNKLVDLLHYTYNLLTKDFYNYDICYFDEPIFSTVLQHNKILSKDDYCYGRFYFKEYHPEIEETVVKYKHNSNDLDDSFPYCIKLGI